MKKVIFVFALILFSFPSVSSAVMQSLNGLTAQDQLFATSSMHMRILSGTATHTFQWDDTPWLVNQGGTGTSTFINGSVVFYNGQSLSENNQNFFWSTTNNALGLGTTTPVARLTVSAASGNPALHVFSSSGASWLYIGSTGNVGLGTANPAEKLDVVGNIKASGTTTTGSLSVTGSATSTFANGINITGGCFAINGVCINAAATSSSNTHSVDLERNLSQYLSIADASQTGLDLTDSFTLEMWVKFETDDVAGLITKRQATGNNRSYQFDFGAEGGVDNLNLVWWSDGSTPSGNVKVAWAPTTGIWYHLAVTKNGTTVKFYVNGVQQGTSQTGISAAIFNGTAPFEIGANVTGADIPYYLDGLIDDVRVWNVARSASDISSNYQKELTGSETSLVAYWKLNNALGDSTANGNTLTNNGSAVFVTDKPF